MYLKTIITNYNFCFYIHFVVSYAKYSCICIHQVKIHQFINGSCTNYHVSFRNCICVVKVQPLGYKGIWTFHTYNILILYHMSVDCDVIIWQIVIVLSCKVIMLDTHTKQLEKSLIQISTSAYSVKKERTINMNMLKAFRDCSIIGD